MTKGDQKWQHNAKTRSSLTNQCCLGWARLHQVTQRWLYMRTEIWSSNPLCSDRSRLSEQRQVSEAELCSWVSSYSSRFSVFVFLQWVWIKIHHIKEVHVHVRARTHTHTHTHSFSEHPNLLFDCVKNLVCWHWQPFLSLIITMLMSCHYRGGWIKQASAVDRINSAHTHTNTHTRTHTQSKS